MTLTSNPPISKPSISQLIINFFTTESNRSYKFFFSLILVFIVSLSLILFNMGSAPINAIPWDIMILLDGGWRIFNGQIPHIDYYNPIGALTYLLTALGMRIGEPSASSVAYGSLLLFLILTPWTWFIARSRFSSFIAFVFVVFIGFLLVAPNALGFGNMRYTTYAMVYNRQGFALLSMLLVELFVTPRASVQPKFFLSGLSSGILLALLFFCKITYFTIGVIGVVIYILLFSCASIWLIGLVSGFSFICITMQVLLNINLIAYISDIRFAGKAQSLAIRKVLLTSTLENNITYVYITLIPLLLTWLSSSKNQAKIFETIKISMIICFIILSGLMICGGNAQWGQDIPLFFTSGIILLEYLRRKLLISEWSIDNVSTVRYLTGLLLIPFLCGNILIKDIGSLIYSTAWHTIKLPSITESQRFQSQTLQDFVIPESSSVITAFGKVTDVTPRINDGLLLIRRHMSNDSRVFSMTHVNPFPFALKLPSPKGNALWWDANFSFNKEVFPQPETVFQDTTIVMIPKFASRNEGCCFETVDLMKELYGNYLKSNFIEKDSSEFWTLLIKRA